MAVMGAQNGLARSYEERGGKMIREWALSPQAQLDAEIRVARKDVDRAQAVLKALLMKKAAMERMRKQREAD